MTNINRHGSEENDGIDKISSLPDDVRTHILSFLTTKEAVQTCVLSKRWIKTWASVPDLKFDIKEFGLMDLEIFYDEMAVEELMTKFELLVKSVLEKRETSCVNRFLLWLDSEVYSLCTQAVADCIGDVIKLRPRECLLEIGLCKNLNLNTDLIFTCASLIHLQLSFSIRFIPFVAIEPNSVNLPCLKTVNLDGVTMSDDSLKKLLLGCHVLEELVLQNCEISYTIGICSNTLKKLVLWSGYDYEVIQIAAPSLLYLKIYVKAIWVITLQNMSSLVDASIYIPGWYDEDNYINKGPELFHILSNVETLQLDFGCPFGKKKDFSNCPVFNNLKSLKLVNLGLYDYAPYFLHHSPKLQELTIENKDALVTEFVDKEITQEGPGDALVQREFLKMVRIVGFKNDNGFVNQLINKLLTHVKIIGDIVIDP